MATGAAVWGAISDRIGGLATVLIGSAWQAASMTAFLLTQNEAGLLLFSGGGMGAGSWLGGLLYDHFGYYAPAFTVRIGANIINLLMISVLVGRQRHRAVYV